MTPKPQKSDALELLGKYGPDDLDVMFRDAFLFTQDHHAQTLQYLAATPTIPLTPERFLSQYVWVVLVSGFRAKIVFDKFPEILKMLRGFDPKKIRASHLVQGGMKIIANRTKWQSIHEGVRLLQNTEWDEFKEKYLSTVDAMETLPHIGPTLKYHLARNLGFDVIKPDLHMKRIAEHFSVTTPEALCRSLAVSSPYARDLRLGQIDYCLWCFMSHAGKVQVCCFNPVDTDLILR